VIDFLGLGRAAKGEAGLAEAEVTVHHRAA
jgi:hypothetical protein